MQRLSFFLLPVIRKNLLTEALCRQNHARSLRNQCVAATAQLIVQPPRNRHDRPSLLQGIICRNQGTRLSEPKIKFITRKFCKKYVNVTFIFSPLQIAMYMKKQRITPIFTFLPPSVTARSVLQCLLNRVLS